VEGQACLSNLRESAPAKGTARWFRSLGQSAAYVCYHVRSIDRSAGLVAGAFNHMVNRQRLKLSIGAWGLTVDGQACLSNLRESAPAKGTARWFRSLGQSAAYVCHVCVRPMGQRAGLAAANLAT
jgi:hypothetical protein